MSGPVLMTWDADAGALRPSNSLARATAEKQFEHGRRYAMEERRDRLMTSHDHYFACVAEVWKNLPDDKLAEFASPEHLRKKTLIACGYRDERTLVCSSKAEALRLAAFLRPADEFAVVIVHECTVIELKAKSQSLKAMGARDFYASKDAVLHKLSEMIGVDVTTLRREAGMAA